MNAVLTWVESRMVILLGLVFYISFTVTFLIRLCGGRS